MSASDKYFDARSKKRDPKDLSADDNFLIESSIFNSYSERSEAYQSLLIEESDSNKPEGENVSTPSCLRMYKEYLKDNVPTKDLLARGVSLENSLKTDQEFTHTWHQPNLEKRGTSPMTHHEVLLLQYSKNDFLLGMEKLNLACQNQQRNHLNTTISPCFIQTIKITEQAYDELLQAKQEGKASYTITIPTDHPSLIEIPVGYTVSDGHSDSLTITFPWETVDEFTKAPGLPTSQSFRFNFTNLPKEVVNFLQSQQIKITDNAATSLSIMKSFLHDFYDIKSNLQFVDIASIAVAAGCRMDSLDLFSLASVTFDCPFPRDIDHMDQMWAWARPDQPDLIFKYMSGKLTVLWELFKVLIGCLIRNLLPDPDITLYALRMSEESFISWFIYFTCKALLQTDPSISARHCEKKSRADMLRKIKTGDNHLLEKLADLYISIPVAQCGGARYLHHVRSCFFDQFAVLERIHLPTYVGEQPRPRDNLLDRKYELMYKREFVIDDSGTPVKGYDLQPSPQFAKTIFVLNINMVSSCDVQSLDRQHFRQFYPAICEWARLNCDKLNSFFIKLKNLESDQLSKFWFENIRAYDYMRSCYYRMFGHRLGVRVLDLVMAKREDNTRSLLERCAIKNPSRVENERINMYEDLAEGDNDDRVGLSQSVYSAVPGSHTERNRAWNQLRMAKRKAMRESDPDRLSEREFKKSKVIRVLGHVNNKINGAANPSTSKDIQPQSSTRKTKPGNRHGPSGSENKFLPKRLQSNDLRNKLTRNKDTKKRQPDYWKHYFEIIEAPEDTVKVVSRDHASKAIRKKKSY